MGPQSNILRQGLFFAEVNEREPASPQTPLQKAFENIGLRDERGIISLVTKVEEKSLSLCEPIDGILEYQAIMVVEGLMESGELVSLLIDGDCLGREKIVIFDRSICNISREQLREGLSLSEGRSLKIKNFFVPIERVSFFLSALKVSYRDGTQETIIPTPGEIRLSNPCNLN